MRRLFASMACMLCFAAFALVAFTQPAHAEETDEHPVLEIPRSRQGYWIGFGLSGIAAQLNDSGRNIGVYSGYTGTFRLGQLITQRLGLGMLVEYLPSGRLGKGTDKGSLDGLTLEASYLVWRDLSIHTGFGLGVVMLKDSSQLDASLRTGGGSYFLLGASYDIFPFQKRLTGGWAVTPVFDVHASADGDIHFLAFLAGIQMTWWSGLPNNMLQLPDE